MKLVPILLLITLTVLVDARAFASGQLVIIIDDIGYNQALSERAARLPGAFTLSVLPFTPYSFSSSQLALHHGKELMLHIPMSNTKNMPLGKGGLYTGMGKTLLVTTLRQDLDNLPFIKGVNNHVGSSLTSEVDPMNWVMEEIASRRIYFVDSRTTIATKAYETAQAHNIPSLKRDVFLDDVQDAEAIQTQLIKAIKLARQNGSAVAIGHPYPKTLKVLENVSNLLQHYDVKLVSAPAILQMPLNFSQNKPVRSNELTYCPAPPPLLQRWMPKNNNVENDIGTQVFAAFQDILLLTGY